MEKKYNPVSTYRIQFHKDFSFSDFEKVIPYFEKLGVRTIYASPVFEATPGSQHGYDGINPNNINPEIGTEAQLYKISEKLKEQNIGWIQDIVPNHLAFHENNQWLMDVLANGKHSAYAAFFDIDWNHPAYPGKVMVPFPGSTLEQLLKEKSPGEKNYILCTWQETDHTMNYRRFFLVNSLICTNIHFDNVFHAYHQLIQNLVEKGIFQGLRIDHIDGLYDPTKYLNDLRNMAGRETYIIVEKILEPGEEMPDYWPVEGNSGYDFLGMVNNLFTNRNSEFELLSFYYDITDNSTQVSDQIKNKKSDILHRHMRGELDNLTRLYRNISGEPELNDEEIKQSIANYLINCPVYRYYDDGFPVMERDQNKNKAQLKPFYQRCMQFSGPLMAKGVEDTLMYTYNKFIGHNEVGDSPEFFGYTVNEFHGLMQQRALKWPLSLNATSTHDTKRGEDVRARLNALTDLYEEWIPLVKKWLKKNEHLKTDGLPDRNDEYFIYQTLIGSYPVSVVANDLKHYPVRIGEYLRKSLREAKVHSNWTEPNEKYETAAIRFVQQLIEAGSPFMKSFMPFFRKVTDYGMINSFSQLVLKFTCPGVPDVYQGTELWDLSLVDPDNRRPVDYELRLSMLNSYEPLNNLWRKRNDGNIKLSLLHRLQIARNMYRDVFEEGDYLPLQIAGECSDHALAFMRSNRHTSLLVVVPLNFAAIHDFKGDDEMPIGNWKDTKIILPHNASTVWEDLLNEGTITSLYLNEVLTKFPAAVLKATRLN